MVHRCVRSFALLVFLATAPYGQTRFVSPHGAFASGQSRSGFLFGDVTGDGVWDRLEWWNTSSAPPLFLVRGDPDGLFEFQRSLIGDVGRDAVLSDVDLDGDLDLIGSTHVFVNMGDGTFVDESTRIPPGVATAGGSTCIGDVDGDGDPDLVSYTAGRVALNDGTGYFVWTPESIHLTLGFSPVLLDIDGDDDLDLAVVHGYSAKAVTFFENDGTGSFSVTQLIAVSFYTGGLELIDLNGDHVEDLVVLPSGRALLNVAGQFVSTPGPETGAVVAFDANADGRADFVARDSSVYSLWLGTAEGEFELSTAPFPRDMPATSWADVDGDGDADLVSEKRIALGDGTGAFIDAVAVDPRGPLSSYSSPPLAVGDVDGDGDLDGVGVDGRGVFVDRNDGATHFVVEYVASPSSLTSADALTLFDADADGDQDLLTEGRSGVQVLFNDGSGAFDAGAAQTLSLPDPMDRAVSDFDGDGDADLLFLSDVSSPTTQQTTLTLFLNDGLGSFSDGALGLGTLAWHPSLAVADVDADGDDDVFLSSTGATSEVLLLNDGAGEVTPTNSRFPPPGRLSERADPVFFDADGDGDLDLALRTTGPRDGLLWFNNGKGFFRDSIQWQDARSGAGLAAGDVDGDGDVDLVDGSHRVWINDGTGALTLLAAPGTGPSGPSNSRPVPVVLGDMDQDGDLDAFYSIPRRVRFNAMRQIAWRALPRIGKPLAIDLYGDPGAFWVLWSWPSAKRAKQISQTGSLSGPGDGAYPVAAGRLDANGRRAYVVRVPNDLALVGRSVDWQAMIGRPLRRSNRERTTLTAY